MELINLLFTNKGRLNRASYIVANIVLFVMVYVFKAIVHLFFGIKGAGYVLGIIVLIIGFIISLLLLIKRFHDFGKSSYFAIVYLLIIFTVSVLFTFIVAGSGVDKDTAKSMLVVIVFALFLYVLWEPGTAGANKYGNQPASLLDLGIVNDVNRNNSSDSSNVDNK